MGAMPPTATAVETVDTQTDELTYLEQYEPGWVAEVLALAESVDDD